MPLLREHLSEEDTRYYENVFDTNKTGLDHIDQHVYVKMFGYKDVNDYYHSVTMDRFCHNIAVPTLSVGAIDD